MDWTWIVLTLLAVGMFVAVAYSKIQVAKPGCSSCSKKSSGLNE